MNNSAIVRPKPFLKWAGGKRKLIPHFSYLIPDHIENYYEPFLGGGALFFSGIKAKNYVLSDINKELITTYKIIQVRPHALIGKLKVHKNNHNRDYYYKIRSQNYSEPLNIAARFIYLNKTCFNGLYRVNKKGEFNVPIGDYKNPNILDTINILACSKRLKEADLCSLDFYSRDLLLNKNAFFYLDPPYAPVSKTSDFTQYSSDGFGQEDQERLRDYVDMLTQMKAKFLLSNSDCEFIRKLYKGYRIIEIDAARSISCKGGERVAVKELLIRNY